MSERHQWSVVLDGSNVAYEEQTAGGKPKIENLHLAIAALRRQYDQVIVIVDAALRHHIDRPRELEKLIREQAVRQAPADTPADYFVLQTADQLNAEVVSNDTFRQYHRHWPWIEHRRIPYMIIDGRFIIYRPAQVESRQEQRRSAAGR
ncbi:MAG TPA: hypothetical protein PLJ35_18605 [Anaerolineae bacterium]|nr:hypothetical protein [Anaerolineae bacterium]HOR00829.1 hypothetical protein [Anaerolineae bacterium]HPL28027.1 hypothetical protein [Anaerolineae bacterium]